MLKLAGYQRKRQNKHLLINIILLFKVSMHSKIISRKLVYTGDTVKTIDLRVEIK